MSVQSKDEVVKRLTQEVTDIIIDAVEALEQGQSTAYARSRLREISRRLTELEFEFRGGCSW